MKQFTITINLDTQNELFRRSGFKAEDFVAAEFSWLERAGITLDEDISPSWNLVANNDRSGRTS